MVPKYIIYIFGKFIFKYKFKKLKLKNFFYNQILLIISLLKILRRICKKKSFVQSSAARARTHDFFGFLTLLYIVSDTIRREGDHDIPVKVTLAYRSCLLTLSNLSDK